MVRADENMQRTSNRLVFGNTVAQRVSEQFSRRDW